MVHDLGLCRYDKRAYGKWSSNPPIFPAKAGFQAISMILGEFEVLGHDRGAGFLRFSYENSLNFTQGKFFYPAGN